MPRLGGCFKGKSSVWRAFLMNQNKKVNLSVDLLSEVMSVNNHSPLVYNFSKRERIL